MAEQRCASVRRIILTEILGVDWCRGRGRVVQSLKRAGFEPAVSSELLMKRTGSATFYVRNSRCVEIQ